MADDIKVSPTPIQRNALDVATELTLLFYSKNLITTEKSIQDTFLRFYATAETARLINFRELKQYIPEELKEVVEKLYR